MAIDANIHADFPSCSGDVIRSSVEFSPEIEASRLLDFPQMAHFPGSAAISFRFAAVDFPAQHGRTEDRHDRDNRRPPILHDRQIVLFLVLEWMCRRSGKSTMGHLCPREESP
jgi:hypothetical protein